jgi:4,5:9,10-diseco-3-hydroxy-5,9,17-trioxoandrosta-1(10),2-diene-4-oate hydrolase
MLENFIEVEGLRTRYLEQGAGPAVLLLHGGSLGSSADVWADSIAAFAQHGLRAIALDLPGFGLSDNPGDHSVAYRQHFVLAFMDALGLDHPSLIGHSQAGAIAVNLAFAEPQRVAKVVVLATGSLLPPLPSAEKQQGPNEGDEGGATEPTLEETRKLLEHNLFNHALITPAILQTRQRMSIGKNFEAFIARKAVPGMKAAKAATPLWRRLVELPVPLLMLYGKQDRASAGDRAALAKQEYPGLKLHVIEGCKHLVQWDAAQEFVELSARFLLESPNGR